MSSPSYLSPIDRASWATRIFILDLIPAAKWRACFSAAIIISILWRKNINSQILIFKIIIKFSLSNWRCIYFAILTLHLHVTQFISPYGRTLGCQTAPFSYTAPRTLHPPALSTSSSVRICGRSLSLLCSTTSSGFGGGGSLHIYWKRYHIFSQ